MNTGRYLFAALSLAAMLAGAAPNQAWAVVCENAGAGANSGTDTDFDTAFPENNTACGLDANASGGPDNGGNTAIGVLVQCQRQCRRQHGGRHSCQLQR